ncbi:thioesterase II family protein [Kitasatospora cheerisanensis]|uniref:Thioesterase domain-containing protein n=1 Tax=Kitasatospora cheerisanensis KCTC 2395 TaxID=1348663 RepID=A0A066Z114_9ACTN|nr:thioesterase domain-containing protein [Kitasatospora cheerisanensis]KDN83855.1 hypothetical protein KCH_45040 [Kitasatospora cheerisanensis KCTC 2395]
MPIAPDDLRRVTAEPLGRTRPVPGARLRLICFPHSGAAPAAPRWAQAVGPDIEVWHAVLPGRAGRAAEPFATRWEPLVTEFADAVQARVGGPYALFGQSLGAMVAFEVARELQRRGAPPVHLITAASAAPDDRLPVEVPADDQELIRTVERHYAGIPAAVRAEPDLLAHFLPPLRADLELAAAHRYAAGPPLGCPVTAFAGDRDRTVPAAALAGWHGHTAADCEIHRLDGGHFCLGDHEEQVLAVVRRRLGAAR